MEISFPEASTCHSLNYMSQTRLQVEKMEEKGEKNEETRPPGEMKVDVFNVLLSEHDTFPA